MRPLFETGSAIPTNPAVWHLTCYEYMVLLLRRLVVQKAPPTWPGQAREPQAIWGRAKYDGDYVETFFFMSKYLYGARGA